MKIKKIELETSSKKSIELTLDEAKELYAQLHELFGKEAPIPIVIDRWLSRPHWQYPWYSTSTGDNVMLFNSDNSTGLKTTITCDTTQ